MYKNDVVTINYDLWKRGIGLSPYVGVADLRNVDMTEPGILKCGYKAVKESGTTITEFVTSLASDQSTYTYAGDASGDLYRRTGLGSWNTWRADDVNETKGMAIWKGHLIHAGTGEIEATQVEGGSAHYNSVGSFAEGTRDGIDLPHTMLVGQDDVLYITDGRYIATLSDIPGTTLDLGGDAGVDYSWNAEALDLPEGYVALSLSELGQYLIIGSKYGAVNNRGNTAKLFPWDRTSSSYNLPMDFTGNGIWNMKARTSILYTIVDNRSGNIYASNLSTSALKRKLIQLAGTDEFFEFDLYPEAIDFHDTELLYGIGTSSTGVSPLGVYAYDPDLDCFYFKNELSCGLEEVEIGAIHSLDRYKYLVSWTCDGTHGIDVISQEERYTDYKTRLDSPMYVTGTALNKKKFSQVEVDLAKPLTEGQGVKVWYRDSITGEFVLMHTFDFASYSSSSAMSAKANIPELAHAQFRVELTTADESPDSPYLREVRIF